MTRRNWVQDMRDDIEHNRHYRELYFEALIFAVGALFDAGHEDKGKEAMIMAGLPLDEKKEE